MTDEKKSEEQLNNKLIENIRNTLKARLIANLPADCEGSHGMASGYGYVRKFVADTSYVRKFVADTIDRFEFDWYLKEARQQGRVEERKKIEEEFKQMSDLVDEKKLRKEFKNLPKRCSCGCLDLDHDATRIYGMYRCLHCYNGEKRCVSEDFKRIKKREIPEYRKRYRELKRQGVLA